MKKKSFLSLQEKLHFFRNAIPQVLWEERIRFPIIPRKILLQALHKGRKMSQMSIPNITSIMKSKLNEHEFRIFHSCKGKHK